MSEIRHLEINGTPYERGKQHGSAFAEEIQRNKDFYLDYFKEKGLDERKTYRYATDTLEEMQNDYSWYVREMEGVADASGLNLEDVAIINFRHTILYSAFSNAEPEGCTSFGVLPEVTESSSTYIGQNWDWKVGVEKFLLTVRQKEHSDFIALTEAGLVGGKFGLNENSIGFAVNGLNTPDDGADPNRKPSHVRGREILNSHRLDEAVEAIISTPRPTSRNYLIGRGSGEIINIETSPELCFYQYPGDSGFLTHANHFEERGKVKSTLERKVPHSITRKARINRLMTNTSRPFKERKIKNILKDHVGKPKSICRHADISDKTNSHTKASVILNLSDQIVSIANKQPCKNEYKRYTL